MKKFLILFAIFLLAPICAHADIPNGFWELNAPYETALSENNPWGVIYWGNEIIEYIKEQPTSENGGGMSEYERNELMASRLLHVAEALESLDRFEEAAQYHSEYIPYAEALGWSDGVKIAEAKVRLYTPSLRIFMPTANEAVYYGAKFEPSKGVYYGRNWERSTENESMEIVYMYFSDGGDDWLLWLSERLSAARESGKMVELALNCENHGEDIRNIDAYWSNICGMIDVCGEYSDVKIFLRIAAEQNIWDDAPTPEEYISAFRKIADEARKHSNIATVFSVSHASSWYVNMEDYYPGDEYVDWVGISAYMIRHFQGVDQIAAGTEYNDICFTAGRAADPVEIVRETVERFGDRKPIMIAEGGATNYCRPLNEYTYDWAEAHIRMMYNYLPMVYPQIKLMAYFDVSMEDETNEYSIFDKPQLLEAFERVTGLEHFIQNGEDSSQTTWSEAGDYFWVSKADPKPISCYAHIFGTDEPTVSYYIDGELCASSDILPYTANIDFSKYELGEHTLTVSALADSGEFFRRDFTFELQP